MICTLFMIRVFVRHRISENSPAKFYLFAEERVLPFQNNPLVTLQYSPASPPFLT